MNEDCGAIGEVTFHYGTHRHAHKCTSTEETLDAAARACCGIDKNDAVKLLRGGMILDGSTRAVLLCGCAVLVLRHEENRARMSATSGALLGFRPWMHFFSSPLSTVPHAVESWGRILWDFFRTIVADT